MVVVFLCHAVCSIKVLFCCSRSLAVRIDGLTGSLHSCHIYNKPSKVIHKCVKLDLDPCGGRER